MRALPLAALLFVSCSGPAAPPSASTQPAQATRPAPTATVVKLDYLALRRELLTPLGGLIVAMRNGSDLQFHINAFEEGARRVEPQIASDMSFNGNTLHSAIINTRAAISRKSVAELEQVRLHLLEIK